MGNTIYSKFLKGKTFRIIPCFSRWGYDNRKRYLAAAYDSNGNQIVSDDDLELYDANRQCVCSNNNNPSYSTLLIPSYASEARALVDYMETNNFSVNNQDCYIDMHNCSYSLGYFTGQNSNIKSKFNIMIDELAKDWKNNVTWANGDPVDYYNTSTTDHFKLSGKICARDNIEKSFAWFFGKAYSPKISCLLEVQQSDQASCSRYAIAKGMDVTYRWFDEMLK